jgi:DNA end-binding protein Ku
VQLLESRGETGNGVEQPAELKLALQIVEQAVTEEFEPEQYEDEVRGRILAQIERKADGHEITMEPEQAPKAQVIDLMAALKSSLARKAGDRRPAKRSPTKRKTAAAKKKSSAR